MVTIEHVKTNWDWEQVFAEAEQDCTIVGSNGLEGCTGPPFTREEVVRVIAGEDGAKDKADWLLLCELEDTARVFRFGAMRAGCDDTWWDGKTSGSQQVAMTKELAIKFGLTKSERARLGLKLGDD